MKLLIKSFISLLCGMVLVLLSNKSNISFWALFLAYIIGMFTQLIYFYLNENID